MQGFVWELASRILTTTYPNYRILVKLSNGWKAIYNLTAPGQVPTLFSLQPPPAANPHFPFGIGVDPD